MFTLLGRGHLELQVCGVHVGACVPRPMSLGGSTGPKRQVGLQAASTPSTERNLGRELQDHCEVNPGPDPYSVKDGWLEGAGSGEVRNRGAYVLSVHAPPLPRLCTPAFVKSK